ncbi:TPA: hypothetical protein IQC14_000537 [Listeria monocytogenes]|nr:hypothetical protein [Listeria monocytogenes]
MAKNIYANLAGTWHNLSSEEDCTVGEKGQIPYLWFEEGAEIYNPEPKKAGNSYCEFPDVMVHLKNKSYRIHPSQIQIVHE